MVFRSIFPGADWDALKSRGAAAQRLLWASTSTKNPAYPDTLYVDDLIGPDTVNTLDRSEERDRDEYRMARASAGLVTDAKELPHAE